MPIYEYECEKCGSVFETMQSISAKPLKTCKGMGCNNKYDGKVHRLVSASGFILKGSGWYSSDYPSESRKQGLDKDSQQVNAPAGGMPPVSDSAPAASTTPTESKPIEKKRTPKSPYSSGKGKKAKISK